VECRSVTVRSLYHALNVRDRRMQIGLECRKGDVRGLHFGPAEHQSRRRIEFLVGTGALFLAQAKEPSMKVSLRSRRASPQDPGMPFSTSRGSRHGRPRRSRRTRSRARMAHCLSVRPMPSRATARPLSLHSAASAFVRWVLVRLTNGIFTGRLEVTSGTLPQLARLPPVG
jgi:hypothetical protein